jgi:hypothetical protein
MNAVTTILGKKRKSTASSSSGATSSMYAPDDMIVDRGRKTKLKPKTQSRHSVENCISIVEQQPHYPHRPSRKERSKSRDSRERPRKHPLSETSAPGEKSGANSEAAGSSPAAELIQVKKELEALKKVGRYMYYFIRVC